MFKLASKRFTGRSVLVIEREPCVADMLVRAVIEGGGIVVAEAADVIRATAFLGKATRVNCVVIDVAMAIASTEPIVPLLSGMGIDLIFVASDDGAFGDDQ